MSQQELKALAQGASSYLNRVKKYFDREKNSSIERIFNFYFSYKLYTECDPPEYAPIIAFDDHTYIDISYMAIRDNDFVFLDSTSINDNNLINDIKVKLTFFNNFMDYLYESEELVTVLNKDHAINNIQSYAILACYKPKPINDLFYKLFNMENYEINIHLKNELKESPKDANPKYVSLLNNYFLKFSLEQDLHHNRYENNLVKI